MDNNFYNIINSSLIITTITILSSILIKYNSNKNIIKKENYKIQLFNFYLPIFIKIEPLLYKTINNKQRKMIVKTVENQLKNKDIYAYIDSNFLIIFDVFKNDYNYDTYSDLCNFILAKYNNLRGKLLLPRIDKEYTKYFYNCQNNTEYHYSEYTDIFVLVIIIITYLIIIINLIII